MIERHGHHPERPTLSRAAWCGIRTRAVARFVRLMVGTSVLGLPACVSAPGPPVIRVGSPCAACGMAIQDLRFACERQGGGTWHAYDSIECLVREGANAAGAWLADYDTRTLHAADSLWVVQGDFPSPMGGGLAAFLDRAAADEIARRTEGRVTRLSDVRRRSRGEAR